MSEKSINEKENKKGGKGSFILGLSVVLLAVAGLVFLISAGVGQLHKLSDSEKQKKEYEEYLSPVATLDISPFDDITGADMKELICSSILSLLEQDSNSPYDFEFVEGEVSGMGIP